MRNEGDVSRRRPADPRLPVCVPATVEAAVTEGLPQPGQIVNLSRGGLSLQFEGLLDPGAPVRVTLHIQGRVALTVVGRVAWVDRAFTAGKGSAGVAFKEELSGDLIADLASEQFPTGEQGPASSVDAG